MQVCSYDLWNKDLPQETGKIRGIQSTSQNADILSYKCNVLLDKHSQLNIHIFPCSTLWLICYFHHSKVPFTGLWLSESAFDTNKLKYFYGGVDEVSVLLGCNAVSNPRRTNTSPPHPRSLVTPKFTASIVQTNMKQTPRELWWTYNQDCGWYICIYLDGLSLHAHAQTLLVAAVLTSVALAFIDYTILVFSACIWQVLAYSSLEKPLASFTAGKTVQTLMIHNYSRNSLLIMKPENYPIQNSTLLYPVVS